MKPLKLTMQAFGSYGRRTTISFQEPGQNLFLITGDTGAGKTTIFDAIVFALYGEASSAVNKKDGAELQSQFTELSVEPFVELTFSEGGKGECRIYTVRRVPRHLRPMKRKEGFREESGAVSLIMPDGTEYPQKETDKKLEELVGLTKGQFMQVAMIAQGEFMELLRARSDDKKVIFRKLFQTELYQDITEELGRRRKEKEKELARSRTVWQTEVSHIRIPRRRSNENPQKNAADSVQGFSVGNSIDAVCDYGRTEIMEELKRKIAGEGRFAVTDMEKLLEELAFLCAWLTARRDGAQRSYQEAYRLRDEKRDAYAGAVHLEKFFGQLALAEEELAQCQAAEAEIKEAEILVKELRAAYEIEAMFHRFEDAARLAADTERGRKNQQEKLPVLQEQAKAQGRREAEAKILLDKATENFNRVSERVSKALSLFDRIEEARIDMQAKEVAAKRAKEEALGAQKRLEELEMRELSCKEQAQALAGAEKLLAAWEIKNQRAENLAEEAANMDALLGELERQRLRTQKSKDAYAAASEEYERQNRQYEQARRAFLDAQAGVLAGELRTGEPCPVCGSREHPQPCRRQAGGGALTREALENLEREVEVLRKKQVELAAESESDARLGADKEKTAKEAFQRLCVRFGRENAAFCPGEEGTEEGINFNGSQYEQIRGMVFGWRHSVQEEGKQLKKNAKLLSDTQEQLARMGDELGRQRTAVNEARDKEAVETAAWEGSRAVFFSLENARDYQKVQDALDARQAAQDEKEREAAVYERAKSAARTAETAKEQAKTLLQKFTQELPAQEEQMRQRKAAYEEIMAEKALADARWKALTERYQKEDADTFQAKINDYNEKRASAEKMRAVARKAIGDQKRPDLELVKRQMEEAEQKRKEAEEILEKYKGDHKTNSEVYAVLVPRMEERGKILEEHTRLDTLYRLVSGNVSGSRMDLETYVQRCYLERILHGANRRFREMSAGQYELRMYGLEKAGEGRNRGLDLMVYSSVTGKEREIRTLSGGESFMAALSLALGMADQIQENSAALNLDIMFIDEGFGSLDEHARNQAVRVLRRMAEGSRLIGIISHVTELKQEIEDQLIVTKDQKGSSVKWQIS